MKHSQNTSCKKLLNEYNTIPIMKKFGYPVDT